ncbi:MAG: SH3 domain-containing protein [Bdellovibrionales bacterium]|nr:SH3 domain-containing protein [Bdellovibrionales bacterium]
MVKWLFIFFLFSSTALASQKGTVITEGAIVYKGPSFDAPILGYFSAGKKVSLSNKLFGAFYKVRFKQGVIGYISDIDVRPENGRPGADNFFPDSNNEEKNKKRPFFGSTHIGLLFGMVDYEDTVGGFTGNSQTNFIGGTLTTPFSFFDGAFLLSLNVLYSLEVPDFYSKISLNAPDGFVVIGDIGLLYPFADFFKRKLTAFIGAGVGVTYTDVELVQEISGDTKLVPTSSAKVGGVFSGGLVYKFSSLALRFEPKYYYEENAYLGITASLSFQF